MEKIKGIFEIIKTTASSIKQLEDERRELEIKRKEEINETVKKIEIEYQTKLTGKQREINSQKKQLENQEELLKIYSTFDSEVIGSILEQLVSIIENEKYTFQKATHKTFASNFGPYGYEHYSTSKKVLMIVKGQEKEGLYEDRNHQENELENLVSNHQAILLSDNQDDSKSITFYKHKGSNIVLQIKYGKFTYVKEFIEFIIQHRFTNDLKEISQKELLSLMKDFICTHKNLIEENIQRQRQDITQRILSSISQLEEKSKTDNNMPSKDTRSMLEKLEDAYAKNPYKDLNLIDILYGGTPAKAEIIMAQPDKMYDNCFISKIMISAFIKDYWEEDIDPHLEGEINISLVDDGLVGFIDISKLKPEAINIIMGWNSKSYRFQKIDSNLLRILYLPNQGNYRHKKPSVYRWIIENGVREPLNSYQVNWDVLTETNRLLSIFQEINILSTYSEEQLRFYKRIRKFDTVNE